MQLKLIYPLTLYDCFRPEFSPWLYYMNLAGFQPIDGDDVLLADVLTVQYTFSPVSYLDYRVARYSLEGEYMGMSNVRNGRIQLCPDTSERLNAAFTFGTYYAQSVRDCFAVPLFTVNAWVMLANGLLLFL